MRTNVKLVVGGVCIPLLFAALAVTTMGGGAAEFVSPTDIEEGYSADRVNLEGVVTDLDETTDGLRFTVRDPNASVPVVYEGQMPETMAEGRTVVAKGYFNGTAVEANSLSVRAHEGEHPEGVPRNESVTDHPDVPGHDGSVVANGTVANGTGAGHGS
jgi:cytochrome c-type biogenesis protein CcmE